MSIAINNNEPLLTVIDPLSRKIDVPRASINDTKAIHRDGCPSLCLLFMEGRCRQGNECNQIHADPNVVRVLRDVANTLPTCCQYHGDSNKVLFDNFPEWKGKTLAIDGVIVPLEFAAFTQGLQRSMEGAEHNPRQTPSSHQNQSVVITPTFVCRLQAGGHCRYSEECKFVHLCREVTQQHLSHCILPLSTDLERKHKSLQRANNAMGPLVLAKPASAASYAANNGSSNNGCVQAPTAIGGPSNNSNYGGQYQQQQNQHHNNNNTNNTNQQQYIQNPQHQRTQILQMAPPPAQQQHYLQPQQQQQQPIYYQGQYHQQQPQQQFIIMNAPQQGGGQQQQPQFIYAQQQPNNQNQGHDQQQIPQFYHNGGGNCFQPVQQPQQQHGLTPQQFVLTTSQGGLSGTSTQGPSRADSPDSATNQQNQQLLHHQQQLQQQQQQQHPLQLPSQLQLISSGHQSVTSGTSTPRFQPNPQQQSTANNTSSSQSATPQQQKQQPGVNPGAVPWHPSNNNSGQQ